MAAALSTTEVVLASTRVFSASAWNGATVTDKGRSAASVRCRISRLKQASGLRTNGIPSRRAVWRCDASPADVPTVVPSDLSPELQPTPQETETTSANEPTNSSASVNVTRETPIAYDYGYKADIEYRGPTIPASLFKLAFTNFDREFAALRRNFLFESDKHCNPYPSSLVQRVSSFVGCRLVDAYQSADRTLTQYGLLKEMEPPPMLPADSLAMRQRLQQLTLNDAAVAQRERSRPKIQAPFIILLPYQALCLILDIGFANRPIQRFWFLETVARMPYFSYISMLHLYETLGWWHVGEEVRKVHFAEEWNEMNHLKIMESLGGNQLWIDRFFAQHSAVLYYWVINLLFVISPRVSYNLSELIECHAVDTYEQFAVENEERLKALPPSTAAVRYYCGGDLYMFDEFQTSRVPESRRPKIENLYDVFCAIRDDEVEHVKTMCACKQLGSVVLSPNRPGYAPKGSPADEYYPGQPMGKAELAAAAATAAAAGSPAAANSQEQQKGDGNAAV